MVRQYISATEIILKGGTDQRWASTLENRSNARHRSTPPPPQIYVSKVGESVWPEGQEAIHS
jgi:hypothetical protein